MHPTAAFIWLSRRMRDSKPTADALAKRAAARHTTTVRFWPPGILLIASFTPLSAGFNCDWCFTEGKCGHAGLQGQFDCTCSLPFTRTSRLVDPSWLLVWTGATGVVRADCYYPANTSFDALSYQEKTDYFWGRITESRNHSSYASAATVLITSSQTTFYDMTDELPAGRVKAIHTVGAICQFALDITADSPYTGLLAPGKQSGFLRMGGALGWDLKKGYPPGIGFKFPRSGAPSGHFVTLHSVDAATYNFFALNQSNHLPGPASLATTLLIRKFQQASQCPGQVGLSNLATYTQDGQKVATPKFPFKLFLAPLVQKSNEPKLLEAVLADLTGFAVGTPLYAVYACGKGAGDAEMTPTDGGVETACADALHLGDLITTTECTTSKYGDEKFLIRHQPVEEDWLLNPDILNEYGESGPTKACAWSGDDVTPTGIPPSCNK
jgi:hypothetical protein